MPLSIPPFILNSNIDADPSSVIEPSLVAGVTTFVTPTDTATAEKTPPPLKQDRMPAWLERSVSSNGNEAASRVNVATRASTARLENRRHSVSVTMDDQTGRTIEQIEQVESQINRLQHILRSDAYVHVDKQYREGKKRLKVQKRQEVEQRIEREVQQEVQQELHRKVAVITNGIRGRINQEKAQQKSSSLPLREIAHLNSHKEKTIKQRTPQIRQALRQEVLKSQRPNLIQDIDGIEKKYREKRRKLDYFESEISTHNLDFPYLQSTLFTTLGKLKQKLQYQETGYSTQYQTITKSTTEAEILRADATALRTEVTTLEAQITRLNQKINRAYSDAYDNLDDAHALDQETIDPPKGWQKKINWVRKRIVEQVGGTPKRSPWGRREAMRHEVKKLVETSINTVMSLGEQLDLKKEQMAKAEKQAAKAEKEAMEAEKQARETATSVKTALSATKELDEEIKKLLGYLEEASPQKLSMELLPITDKLDAINRKLDDWQENFLNPGSSIDHTD